MSFLKTVSRLVTLPIPCKKYRKKARIKLEEVLDLMFLPEKSKCIRGVKKECAYNASLPRDKFHIVSLGTNCFPRLTLTLWEMKPRKAEGELSMPFDLSVHPLDTIVQVLKTDFSGYFDDIVYDDEHGYWINPTRGIKFIHDHEKEKDIFVTRFQNRISNFQAALKDDKPCLFVCHIMGDAEPQKINELYDLLAQSCKYKKFKLVVAVFNGTLGKCNENVKVYVKNFPYKDYSYMDKKIKFTKDGYDFEYTFVACCREELLKLLED